MTAETRLANADDVDAAAFGTSKAVMFRAADLPRVNDLITTVRSLETNTAKDAGTKLSGRAMLGLVLARLPGKPLETYLDASTRKGMEACELRERELSQFFGPLGSAHDDPRMADHARAQCSELAFRPMVWDLTALALQWEGKEREISVSKLEKVDPDRHAAARDYLGFIADAVAAILAGT